MGEPSYEDIDDFILDNDLDDRAADALRGSKPAVQRVVLDRGTLRDTRNPSSAVLGRIKDAQLGSSGPGQGSGAVRSAGHPAASRESSTIQWAGGNAEDLEAFKNVEDFITANDLDERAADAIRGCGLEVQQAVLARGSLRDARNPSSALLGRIKDVSNILGPTGGGHRPIVNTAPVPSVVPSRASWVDNVWGSGARCEGVGPVMNGVVGHAQNLTRQDVENFIVANAVDERAADALLGSPPYIQRAVLERGDLRDARNPSSAVLGRIKDAQAGPGVTTHARAGSWGVSGCGDSSWGASRSAQPLPSVAWGNSTFGAHEQVFWQGGNSWNGSGDVQEFIKVNGLDDRAAEALLGCPLEVQRAVLLRGDLQDARNPSSAVLGRIRDAQQAGAGGVGGGCTGCNMGAGSVANVGGAWGTGGPMSWKSGFAMSDGYSRDDASGYSWPNGPSRGLGGSPATSSRGLAGEVEEFIRENALDDRASDAIRGCHPDVQRAVLDRGTLRDARNPSSAVLGRIRDAQAATGAGAGAAAVVGPGRASFFGPAVAAGAAAGRGGGKGGGRGYSRPWPY